jgi:hypothetical protein
LSRIETREEDVVQRAIVLMMLLWAPAPARAATVADVTYVKGGPRRLIFVNNPEQIYSQDLGDRNLGNRILLTLALQPGAYRDFYQHLNRSGGTIGCGIQLYNPNPHPVTVRIHGQGFVASSSGGRPFVELLNNHDAKGKAHTVPPYRVLWIARRDGSVPSGAFFSGVVDFTVCGGAVFLHNYAYRRFWSLDGTATYMGYIQRKGGYNNHDEARVYKGISAHSEVAASKVDFTITDADHGELPVRYASYDLTAAAYGAPKVRPKGWYSNVGPGQNPDAVSGDMVTFELPGWGPVDPLTRSDGTGNYPNLGNWGVVYRVSGTITNLGSYTRKLSVNLRAPPGGVVLAYRHGKGQWRELRLKPNQYIQYAWVSAPPTGKPVSYEATYVLGGPSCGNLFQAVAVNN